MNSLFPAVKERRPPRGSGNARTSGVRGAATRQRLYGPTFKVQCAQDDPRYQNELSRLTLREREIVDRIIFSGASNQQIAEALEVSKRTIDFHLFNIYEKLKIKNRDALIIWVLTGTPPRPLSEFGKE